MHNIKNVHNIKNMYQMKWCQVQAGYKAEYAELWQCSTCNGMYGSDAHYIYIHIQPTI
jgi:hypothetical protein